MWQCRRIIAVMLMHVVFVRAQMLTFVCSVLSFIVLLIVGSVAECSVYRIASYACNPIPALSAIQDFT